MTMTLTRTSQVSQMIAAELRAEMGRQGLSQRGLATRMGTTHTRINRRISLTADQELTFVDVLEMTEALGVSAERFLSPLLPRLDSNQQPSGYLSSLVTVPTCRDCGQGMAWVEGVDAWVCDWCGIVADYADGAVAA